jgi:hypothetical protein
VTAVAAHDRWTDGGHLANRLAGPRRQSALPSIDTSTEPETMTPKNLLRSPSRISATLGDTSRQTATRRTSQISMFSNSVKKLQPAQGFEVARILDRRVLVEDLVAHRRQSLAISAPFR